MDPMEVDGIHKGPWAGVRRRYSRKRHMWELGALALILVIVIVVLAKGGGQRSYKSRLPSTFHSFQCDSIVATERYYSHVVDDLANNHFKRCRVGKDCECPSPTTPGPADDYPGWHSIVKKHHILLHDLFGQQSEEDPNKLDVLLLGADVMERWLGYKDGSPSEDYDDVHEIFLNSFASHQHGHRHAIRGHAMGVGRDGFSSILYRLQKGDLDTALPISIVWILAGETDLHYRNCNDHAVVAGWVQIVQEIKSQLPNARIVINSVLPMPDSEMGTEVRRLNERLHCYALQTPNVDFFDATPIFGQAEDPTLPQTELFVGDGDYLHPNEMGYELWAQSILTRTHEIMREL